MDRFDRNALHSALRRAHYPASTAQLCEELSAPIEISHHDRGGYWYAEKACGNMPETDGEMIIVRINIMLRSDLDSWKEGIHGAHRTCRTGR
jgi:hypothetical protein